MKKFVKNNDLGITSIALVITVIVLLILAGISISMLSGDNSILQKATDAKNNTEKANEKEQIQIEVLGSFNKNGNLEIATVNSNIKSNISGVTTDDATEFPLTVTYTSTGNSYSVDGDGNVEKAINYPLASEILILNPSAIKPEEKSPYVNYTDNDGNTILCRVLYNAENGIEIITNNSISTITLGSSDPTTTSSDFIYEGSGTIDDSTKHAAASYNRAIITLNEKAESYRNKTNGISDKARCVGSNQTQTEDTTRYINTTAYTYMETYGWNNKFKVSDNNYSIDQNTMDSLGIIKLDAEYWMASRYTEWGTNVIYFNVRHIQKNSASIGSQRLCGVLKGGTSNCGNFTFGFRPVFHLVANVKIIGGDGTAESPYELSL